jgi:glycosyltransferase involved in cell wall biosynthesis
MKVCLISSVDVGMNDGSTVRPYYMSKNLARFGCEILHICINPPEIEEENIKYSLKKYSKNKLWCVRTFMDFFRMYKECKEFSPDVIYAHQIANATRILPLKFLLKKPFVFDAHGSSVLELDSNPNISFYQSVKIKLQEKTVLKKADKIVVPANYLKNYFNDYFGISKEKIAVIENGVDLDLFKPEEPSMKKKEEFGISDSDKVVVFTCPRFVAQNQISLKYLFELVPKIEDKVNNIKFLIVGGGPKLEPPSSNVIYTGFVNELAPYINLGDVCIAPYPLSAMYGTAGAKNKIMEYFACGKPVISTEEGIRGFDDAISDHNFLLALDSDDFVDKLTTVLYDETLSKKLGENARAISLKYDWKELSKEVFKVLESVANKKNK